MNFELLIVDYASEYYPQILELRNHVLRKPLGLNLFDEDLSEDKNQYVVAAIQNEEILGCLMIKILDKDTVKYRQMAIKNSLQKKGIGTTILKYADNFCILNDYTQVLLHARKTAKNFYIRNGFEEVGDEFEEVGIPHIVMQKQLSLNQ
jgi:predicted GNAT family N-acyltransferase